MRTEAPDDAHFIDYRQLEPFQGDLKDLSNENYDKLLTSIKDEGFFVPVFVWKDGDKNYLLDGHGRLRVLTKEKIEFENTGYEIPCYFIPAKSFKSAKKRLLKITSQYQTITYEGFQAYIDQAEIPEAEIVEAVHFDGLPLLGQHEDEEVEEDEAPEVDDSLPPISKLGELYQLGRHRVMCGDSTDLEQQGLLIGDQDIDMVFTDPPYGLGGYGGRNKMDLKGDDEDVLRFYECIPMDLPEIYIWGNYKNLMLHLNSEPRDVIVWVKNNFGLGKGYRGQYELCFYFGSFNGSDSDVWRVDKDPSYEHPTQKPIALIKRAIRNSKPTAVLDLYGGSGSTLIGCESEGISSFLMELDPKYVDVIRKRYAKFIGEKDWEAATPVVNKTDENQTEIK